MAFAPGVQPLIRRRHDRKMAQLLPGRRIIWRAPESFSRAHLHQPSPTFITFFSQSHRSELNRRPLDYESRALPLSYGGGTELNLVTCCSTRYSTASGHGA